MNRLFEYSNTFWVKYSDYVIRETSDGIKYLQAAPKAMPQPYDPIENFEKIVVDAVNVGRLCMKKERPEDEMHDAIRGFALKYGLLGIYTHDVVLFLRRRRRYDRKTEGVSQTEHGSIRRTDPDISCCAYG